MLSILKLTRKQTTEKERGPTQSDHSHDFRYYGMTQEEVVAYLANKK